MDTARIARILNAMVDRSETHRIWNGVLAAAYVAFILFGHDTFVKLSIRAMNALTLPVYDAVVAAITVAVGVAFLTALVFFIRKNGPQRPRQIFYLSAIVLMLVLHYSLLFEMNIEVIHAALYAGLAFLLFPFARRPGATILLALPVMMLDEWYQYRVLYPESVQYLDLNDVLMDVLGSGLMLCGMWTVGVRMEVDRSLFLKDMVMLAVLVSICAMALAGCVVVLFPGHSCPQTWLVLNRLPDPMEFWRVHPFTGRTYHAMPPLEGLAVISAVTLFFTGMGTRTGGTKD
ncbi:MAG: hypothetical protein K9J06_02285 [Flavobacteriales bacterium]|nr:hypothetical protein [Flavobacteriales bacterium]